MICLGDTSNRRVPSWDFLKADPKAALETVGLIEEAVGLLARHPLIGRPVESSLRELAISRGRTGHAALCRMEEAQAAVLIPAIRHRREAGYRGEEDD